MTSMSYLLAEQVLVDCYKANRNLAKEIIRQGCVQSVNKGVLVYVQGGSTDTITFLLDGVMGFHHTDTRDSGLFHNVIYPGFLLNEIQFFLGGTSPLDIRTATKCCVLTMSFKGVDKLIAKSLEFNQMLNHSMARKQKLLSEFFHLGSERQPHRKVYQAIKILGNFNRNLVANVSIFALASLLNMSRNTVGAAIRDLLMKQAIEKVPSGYKVTSRFVIEDIKQTERLPLAAHKHIDYCGVVGSLN
ncbi:Crp/Fnr family transcriptional regulator [Vibrio maritimus]|uniref:Crp/Fnr family transcriptional regulator n=1 Tax=Vibrio maritimus TaxID=990268 RepID=UPI0040692EA1